MDFEEAKSFKPTLIFLKEGNKLNYALAKAAGIKKHLSTHIARHTFATTVTYENDVLIESVSKMLGHRSIRIMQIYAKSSL